MSTQPFLICLLLFIFISNFFSSSSEKIFSPEVISPRKKIILIPLDSRPPCKDFVIDAAKISNAEIICPDYQLLDYFTIPSEINKIRNWLIKNSAQSDAIILSIDQILYGGLIASRENNLTDEQIDSLERFLIDLRNSSNVPIYAFSILPRLQPQQSIDNFFQRRALIAYSRFRGMIHENIFVDDEMIFETLNEIKDEKLKIYIGHFKAAEKLNQRLIELTQKNILDRLIIGVDDGEKFSIQNELADNLRINNEKISLIHGADEIALTLLAEIFQKNLKICVQYCDDDTAEKILPYMAIPIKNVVGEKISQLKLKVIDSPDKADFTLFIFVNDKFDSYKKISSFNKINNLIKNNYKVALVDLSENFNKDETLLPVLIRRGVAINSLIAYAGWNTASNSIGTAISQAVLYQNPYENLIFLNQRFLEDYFYLKDAIDTVNHALKLSGSYDTSYLDYGTEYEFATKIMRVAMNKKISDYKKSSSFQKEIEIDGHKIIPKDFEVNMNYGWPRTFEIRLKIKNFTCVEVK